MLLHQPVCACVEGGRVAGWVGLVCVVHFQPHISELRTFCTKYLYVDIFR